MSELALLVKRLENLDNLTNTELILLIVEAPDIHKKNAWNQLMKREPLYNGCFSEIVARSNDFYKLKAWEILLARSTNDMDFCMIFSNNMDLNNPYLKKAWEIIIAAETTDSYSFLYLIDYAQQPYKNMALNQFLKRRYPINELKSLLCGRRGKETIFWKEKIGILFKE